jgi:hypothetical protein
MQILFNILDVDKMHQVTPCNMPNCKIHKNLSPQFLLYTHNFFTT